MLIIDKDDLDKYRFAVAKVTFLKTYKRYELIDDLPRTNCFLAIDKITQSKIIISLLQKPDKQYREHNYEVISFYQKNMKTKNKVDFRVELLSKEFNILFEKELNKSLYSAALYYYENKQFTRLLDEVLYDAVVAKNINGLLCKYYSAGISTNDTYGRIDGTISFLNPTLFNDPFDCNCMNYYHKSI